MTPKEFIAALDGWIWGWGTILLILAAGVYLTIRTRAIQARHPGLALRYTVTREEGAQGEVSAFGALCTALSATIGTGNIVGVATAITAGGPGALLWMLVAAIFGMATKYAEGVLAVKYREQTALGHYLGGPFCYIEKGLGKRFRWMGKSFALFGVLAGLLGIGTVTQVNSITAAAQDFFDPEKEYVAFSIGGIPYAWTTVIAGLAVTVSAALVIIGGIRRIATVSGVAVPFMAATYVLFVGIILALHAGRIPAAVGMVVRSAFDVRAAGGAVAGVSLRTVIQKGIGRGVFSNEAGLGSAPIAAAAAKTSEPVRQGLVSMTGTLIDTVIICTMTGLSIVITGAWDPTATGEHLQGVQVTCYAWQKGLPFDETFSSLVLMLCLVFFAFTTILGWNYYAQRCTEYLSGCSRTAEKVFRWLYILAVLVGPYLTASTAWEIADVCNAMMAFPNLIALFLLGGTVAKETNDFFERQKRSPA